MSEINPERAKILGDLVEKAREHFGRTKKECAAVLGMKSGDYSKVETGEYPVSLPQLEALALFLNIPMGYFWGSEPLQTESEIDFENLIALRHRVIGVLLSQQRLRTRQSLAELAEALGMEEDLLKSYEMGQEPIPYLHLEQICRQLDVSVSYFLDDVHGPLGRHEAKQKLERQFKRMPPDMQAFLINPVNVSYLDTAKKLSEMDVVQLRQVAESLLEITY
ncbi:MAG: helix-turn-helix transcriptional regulator [Ardenticatenaceae bacterium]|nr:helix-turn-helix transcriptional regulator [Ardenticatenaceae bacterium]MCB8949094.1 helix-turn-helix transcriptional regulator [Ardenticatenaceae bacterium]